MLVLRFMLVMVIYGSGFWVLGSGFRVLGSAPPDAACRMPDYGLRGNFIGLFSRDER
jgi:hypothetical protein